MSAVSLLACVLLLGGHGASSETGAKYGCFLDKSHGPNTKSCESIKWSVPAPRTCKDVMCRKSRTVAKLADGIVVLCDKKTDGGGWIIFQRRVNADVDFYRNWADYKHGFGNISGNFWLGNENIHKLTSQRPHKLRVDITFNGTSYFAKYSKFRIFGEAEKYKLEVAGYSGNAGDSLSNHNGMAFTTKDRDNDPYYANCAEVFHGAWWFNACHSTHLNGQWDAKYFGAGLPWSTTTTQSASATSTEMKIRPLD